MRDIIAHVTRLSVVIPAHNVHGYLRQCVESVVSSDIEGVEAIIVDDCSTDATAQLAIELADVHKNVTTIRPPQNLGLGEARNYGLDRAKGEYVLFLDGDDYLAPGAIESILDRLTANPVDVLLIQYARLYPDGNCEPGVVDEPLQGDVPFTLEERPEVLSILNVAWNKVVRRELLVVRNLRFPVGYYEDIPWTYPLLAYAKSIIGLPTVCYMYRQRWSGSILRSTNSRHLEILGQFELLMDTMDAESEFSDHVRLRVFEAAFVNLINLATGARDRLPRGDRARYYRAARASIRERAPSRDTTWTDGRLSEFGRAIWNLGYARFLVLLFAKRVSKFLQRLWTRAHRRILVAWRKLTNPSFGEYRMYRRLMRVDRSLVAYESLWGLSPRLNPLAVQREIERMYPEMRHVWMVKPECVPDVPEDQEYAVIGSRRYLRLLATAGYFFLDMNLPTEWQKRPGQIVTQLHHGTPIKLMGVEERGRSLRWRRGLIRRCGVWDFSVVSSDYCAEVFRHSYPSPAATLCYGYPRNDVLANATEVDRIEARHRLGVDPGERVILYMPTFRGSSEYNAQLATYIAQLSRGLQESDRFLVRGHYFTPDVTGDPTSLEDVTAYEPVTDLYLAADVMISDYSSAMVDFAILGRPIVVFAFDAEWYSSTRGVYFDISVDAPGPLARSVSEVLAILNGNSLESIEARQMLSKFRSAFCQYEDGKAANRVVRHIIGGESVETPPDVFGPPARLASWNVELLT